MRGSSATHLDRWSFSFPLVLLESNQRWPPAIFPHQRLGPRAPKQQQCCVSSLHLLIVARSSSSSLAAAALSPARACSVRSTSPRRRPRVRSQLARSPAVPTRVTAFDRSGRQLCCFLCLASRFGSRLLRLQCVRQNFRNNFEFRLFRRDRYFSSTTLTTSTRSFSDSGADSSSISTTAPGSTTPRRQVPLLGHPLLRLLPLRFEDDGLDLVDPGFDYFLDIDDFRHFLSDPTICFFPDRTKW